MGALGEGPKYSSVLIWIRNSQNTGAILSLGFSTDLVHKEVDQSEGKALIGKGYQSLVLVTERFGILWVATVTLVLPHFDQVGMPPVGLTLPWSQSNHV